jgi:hypothetical protein
MTKLLGVQVSGPLRAVGGRAIRDGHEGKLSLFFRCVCVPLCLSPSRQSFFYLLFFRI